MAQSDVTGTYGHVKDSRQSIAGHDGLADAPGSDA
jgi:hypothetical protein